MAPFPPPQPPREPLHALDEAIRLLSPHRRRIYPNAQTGNGQKRDGIAPGVGDTLTAQVLMACGWKQYDGLARTDIRGWIIPDTDPELRT